MMECTYGGVYTVECTYGEKYTRGGDIYMKERTHGRTYTRRDIQTEGTYTLESVQTM